MCVHHAHIGGMDNLVTAVRTQLNLSHKQLAEKLGVDRSTVSRWEKKGRVSKFVAPIIEKMLRGKREVVQ